MHDLRTRSIKKLNGSIFIGLILAENCTLNVCLFNSRGGYVDITAVLLIGGNGDVVKLNRNVGSGLCSLSLGLESSPDDLPKAQSNLLRTGLYILLGLFIYWAASLVMAELTYYLMPGFVNINDMSIAAMSQERYLLTAIGTVFLVPVAEECLFRGLLFRGVYGQSRWAAYAISSLCFCLPHISAYIGSYDWAVLALCFIQYLPAGLMLAWSYEKSNTIVTPILIHTIINAFGIYAMR